MKVGDIIRYASFPHEDLHKSGMTGLTISDPYNSRSTGGFDLIDVMWSERRSPSWDNSHITWEYVDELEVIYESR